MRLVLTNGNIIDPESWSLLKKIRSATRTPAIPFKARLLGLLSELVTAPTAPQTEAAPVSLRLAPPPVTLTTRFIFWMEKALMGALLALWSLAIWVMFDGLRLLFF
ncbi:MAG: hypothetical protein HQL98_01585 [Magnetococcales bacterium]|nr:hypothetical protein [Magnetococcales bacterium]